MPTNADRGKSAADPNNSSAGVSNIWRALDFRDQLKQEADAARAAEAPTIGVPPDSPQSLSRTPGSGPGGTGPWTSQPSASQSPAIPKLTAAEMLERAMSLPVNTTVAGRDVTLLDVLGGVTDRTKRLEITHAYWHLVRSLGEYRFCWEESQQIQSIGVGAIDSRLLAAAQQLADRELTAAELAVLQAQYDLAEAAGLDSAGQLPLPKDRPHLGTYNTRFEQIFDGATPPGRTRLLHRILPLQRQVIDVRTDAVHAAREAYQAIGRSYLAGQVDAADLLDALHEITNQRRAWITSVVNYNDSIADYALAVAGPEMTGRGLVSILIKLSQAEPEIRSDKSGMYPAEPGDDFPQRAEAQNVVSGNAGEGKVPGVPTLAPPRDDATETSVVESPGVPPVPVDAVETSDLSVAPASAEAPMPAENGPPFDAAVEPAVGEEPLADSTGSDKALSEAKDGAEGTKEELEAAPTAAAENGETPAPDRMAEAEKDRELPKGVAGDSAGQEISAAGGAPAMNSQAALEEKSPRVRDLVVQTRPMVAVDEDKESQGVRTVYRPPTGSSSAGSFAQHADLIGLSSGVQAKRLTIAFHGGATAAARGSEAIDLETCLDRVATGERRAVIEAYWEASLRLGRYEVHRRRAGLLDDLLESVTLGRPGTTEARARLQAARFDAQAELLEAESRLLAAQYELTARCSRSLDGPWLLPKTLPHAGDYRLHLESQPRRTVESWTLRRLAAIIPVLKRSVSDSAVAVIEADSRRSDMVGAYRAEQIPFGRVLSAVDRQTQESLEFLDVVAAYNQAIADYVTAVVPEELPEKQLVASLVVR